MAKVHALVFRLPDDLTHRLSALSTDEIGPTAQRWAADRSAQLAGLTHDLAEKGLNELAMFAKSAVAQIGRSSSPCGSRRRTPSRERWRCGHCDHHQIETNASRLGGISPRGPHRSGAPRIAQQAHAWGPSLPRSCRSCVGSRPGEHRPRVCAPGKAAGAAEAKAGGRCVRAAPKRPFCERSYRSYFLK